MYVLMYVYKYNLIAYDKGYCRVENVLTLDKLLSLWFCFLLHSILFLISQTSYRTYKIISSYELARPIMGTIFLVSKVPRTYAKLVGYKIVMNQRSVCMGFINP